MATDVKITPKQIDFDCIIEDVCCHPSKDILAAGSIDGDITIHSYSISESNHLLMTLPHHKKACRAVKFTSDGQQLFSASKDKSLAVVDTDQGKLITHITKAHESALYCLAIGNENLVATGDDDGHLKVWDFRQKPNAIMELKENDEFISDIHIDARRKLLLMTSGDGTLTAVDLRKQKMKHQSELFESELLSLCAIKEGRKIVCGSGEGALNIFNWGEWGNISDRFPGHPMSIDCIVALTDDIVCTGSMDGYIRAVNILPNRFLGVVGEHNDFPIENLSLSHCRQYIVSCSHDQTVKFWDVTDVDKVEIDTSKKATKTAKNRNLNADDFFEGLVDEEEKTQDDDDDDDDEESDDEKDSDDDDDEDDASKDDEKDDDDNDDDDDNADEEDEDEGDDAEEEDDSDEDDA